MDGGVAFWPLLAWAAVGYLLGSVPYALLLMRLAGRGDIRKMGSGNVGATNVLREGGTGLAVATLVLDAGKGALAVLLAARYAPDAAPSSALVAGAGAVLGHVFPVWLGFRGGKGVATTLGVLLVASWPTGLAVVATWLAAALIGRYSSLSAIIALALAPVFGFFLAGPKVALLALVLGVLVIALHHTNIRRLLAGEEDRISIGREHDGTG
ncbi:MAG: glycerol-3-phosphate 1-O-acyltransferase PlsY [Alphaproteobacteria bacterium]|nr:glycerol-3-phosphate 1-O-acyltransferase PlsY [Alphaproteobacteria bacterium]